MPKSPMTVSEYEHIVKVLNHLADLIRAHPGMDHNFAKRIALIAEEMAADSIRGTPG